MPEWTWVASCQKKCNKLLTMISAFAGKRCIRSYSEAPYSAGLSGPKRPSPVPGWFHAAQKHVRVVRAGGLEPPRPVRVCGFSYHFGFRRLARRVRGLDYPFTIPRERLRCCPSSLYTFPKTSGLGSGLPFKVSPTLSSSTPPVSLAGTQFP
jgi:hypothetical protein